MVGKAPGRERLKARQLSEKRLLKGIEKEPCQIKPDELTNQYARARHGVLGLLANRLNDHVEIYGPIMSTTKQTHPSDTSVTRHKKSTYSFL